MGRIFTIIKFEFYCSNEDNCISQCSEIYTHSNSTIKDIDVEELDNVKSSASTGIYNDSLNLTGIESLTESISFPMESVRQLEVENLVQDSESDSEEIFFGPITKREIKSKLKHYK